MDYPRWIPKHFGVSMRHFLAIALAVAAGSVVAGETIATRVVPAQTGIEGQVLILDLSDFPPEPGICAKGTFMARITLDMPFYVNRKSRINLGCWYYSNAGTVIYDGWDQVNKKAIHMNMPAAAFTTTAAFKKWADFARN